MWNVAWADVYVLCKATSILYLACYYRLFLNFLLVSFVSLQIALGSSPPCPTHLRTSRHSPGWPPLPCHPHPARKEHPVTAPTPPPRVSKPDLSGKRPNNSHARLLIMTAILSMFKKKILVNNTHLANPLPAAIVISVTNERIQKWLP